MIAPIQRAQEESELPEKCIIVASLLGETRNLQAESSDNLNYRYKDSKLDLVIDCNLMQTPNREGYLLVKHNGRVVFHLSNSYPHTERKDLPEVYLNAIRHKIVRYEPGNWEERINSLSIANIHA